ncbi:MAG: metallophosphoesterase family protein, partial [Dictyoglomus turgidum]
MQQLGNLIELIKSRKDTLQSQIELNLRIGELLANIVNPNKTVSDIMNIHTGLLKNGIYQSALFLLDCLLVYRYLQDHKFTGKLSYSDWLRIASGIKPEFNDPKEQELFWQCLLEDIEVAEESRELKLARIEQNIECCPKHLLEQVNALLSTIQVESYQLGRTPTVVHLADLHFEEDEHLDELNKACALIVEKVAEIKPVLTVIAGDLINSRQYHDSVALLSAVRFIQQLGQLSCVFILIGTKGHDGTTLDMFKNIVSRYPIYVSEYPEVVYLNKSGYFSSKPLNAELRLISLPITNKAPGDIGKPREKTSIQLPENIEDDIPTCLISHGTVKEAVVSSGVMLSEYDYTQEELESLPVKWHLLGHIHKAQVIGDRIFYAGCPIRRQVGEYESKGFWVHNLKTNKHEFIELPVRTIHSVEFTPGEKLPEIDYRPGDIIKVTVKLKEGSDFSDFESIKERFPQAQVRLQKVITPEHIVRVKGISQKT